MKRLIAWLVDKMYRVQNNSAEIPAINVQRRHRGDDLLNNGNDYSNQYRKRQKNCMAKHDLPPLEKGMLVNGL